MEKSKPRRPPVLEGPFDLVVVGGGINGTSIARDATLREKSVLLVERGDFASGTSSASSKMVHGGIRYLEQLRLGLVYESLRERHLLLRLAPHLVRPQSFLIPVYKGAPRGPFMIRLGLFLYDLLALGKRLGKSVFLSPEKALERAPELLPTGLLGGGIYHDAVMDDARLCLANAVATLEEGKKLQTRATVRNYMEMVDYESATPIRVRLRDRLSGETTTVLAHRLVRALGPWSAPELLVPSKGVHVVLPSWPTADGLLLSHSSDGRVFFVIPWRGHTVVGTTETPVSGSPDNLRVEPEEVNYLLEELKRLFPKIQLRPEDVLGTFAGIRPLARSQSFLRRIFRSSSSVYGKPGSVSRKHRVVHDGPGVVSVVGGKYTTYRAIAADVVGELFPGSTCTTHRVPLPGGEGGAWPSAREQLTEEISRYGVEEIERLFQRYGLRLRQVLEIAAAEPRLAEKLDTEEAELRAEVVYALREEFAVYPADFLMRRSKLRYCKGNGRSVYQAVEDIITEYAPLPAAALTAARERYFEACDWEDRLRSEQAIAK